MTNEIIELLPSAELKAKIKETNHRFKESELLEIIYTYAPTFDTRLDLLGRFAEIASHDISALAKTYIEYEQKSLECFMGATDGFVYELHIKESPESWEETYLCASYKDALICIDRFYEAYADVEARETSKTRYKILKRKIFSESENFDEDTYAEMILGQNKVILEVSDHKISFEEFCIETKGICPPDNDEIRFPCFAANHTLVKYPDHEGKIHYSICLCHSLFENRCDGFADYLYVLPMDSTTIRDHRFDNNFLDHDHIAAPLVSFASPDELDETMKKNFFDFLAYWDSHN